LIAQKSTDTCPSETIKKSIKALGGQQRINSIQNLQFIGYGYRNALEQSERFEGPYIPSHFNFNTVLDFKDTLELYTLNEQTFTFNSDSKYLADKTTIAMQSQGQIITCPQDQTIQDDLYLNPLWVFNKALESSSLICIRDSIIQGLPHKRIKFLWNQYPVIVCINPNTYLPTCLEIEKPYTDNYLGIWGDLKKVVLYSFWELLENGVHYPMQKDIYFNGNLWESSVITQIKSNQPLLADSLMIPADVKKAAPDYDRQITERIQKMIDAKKEIAKNIWLIPGFCNSTEIKQNNDLIIIESPNTSSNTNQLIEQARELFPNSIIKYIITTSDAWLHCGGVRSAALNANVIALKENKKIIEALLRANYKTHPDDWQKSKTKKSSIRYIDGRTVLGTGINRIELIPFHTEAGERMMMIYFPEHKLLYASDLLQPGNWEKHYTLEVIQAVEREKLAVETVYAMHMKPVKYKDILSSMQVYLPD
jgi:hypothetical protein